MRYSGAFTPNRLELNLDHAACSVSILFLDTALSMPTRAGSHRPATSACAHDKVVLGQRGVRWLHTTREPQQLCV